MQIDIITKCQQAAITQTTSSENMHDISAQWIIHTMNIQHWNVLFGTAAMFAVLKVSIYQCTDSWVQITRAITKHGMYFLWRSRYCLRDKMQTSSLLWHTLPYIYIYFIFIYYTKYFILNLWNYNITSSLIMPYYKDIKIEVKQLQPYSCWLCCIYYAKWGIHTYTIMSNVKMYTK